MCVPAFHDLSKLAVLTSDRRVLSLCILKLIHFLFVLYMEQGDTLAYISLVVPTTTDSLDEGDCHKLMNQSAINSMFTLFGVSIWTQVLVIDSGHKTSLPSHEQSIYSSHNLIVISSCCLWERGTVFLHMRGSCGFAVSSWKRSVVSGLD